MEVVHSQIFLTDNFFPVIFLFVEKHWHKFGFYSDFCSVDEQVAKDIQLIDSIAEKQAQIFSEECKLFPADVQIQSIYPL